MVAVQVMPKEPGLESEDVDNAVLEVIAENLPGIPAIDFAEAVGAGIEFAFQWMKTQADVGVEDLKNYLSGKLTKENLNLT
jgi:hypothetical protein